MGSNPDYLLKSFLLYHQTHILTLDQLWKIDYCALSNWGGCMLINKANLWNSSDSWEFITNDQDDRIVYIKNTSKNKVLGVINNGRVIEEPIIKGKLGQLWEREREYEEGFYTLRNSESLEVLTAISPKILEIKGNFKVTVASLPLFF